MRSALFQCGGAPIPPAINPKDWDEEVCLDHRRDDGCFNLRLANLSHALLHRVASRAADLVRIAAYAYAADQFVSRGGDTDIYERRWQRNLGLIVPVSEPVFWSEPDTLSLLKDALDWVSGDSWDFWFSEVTQEDQQLPLDLGPEQVYRNPDTVILFSGGADSLSATVEAVKKHGKNPVLVSHWSTYSTAHTQEELVSLLRRDLDSPGIAHVGMLVNRRGGDAAENTQRSRSFLFASLGAAVAAELGIEDVILADNGVTSVNPPINGQLTDAKASRSTHPLFIHRVNRLLEKVFTKPVRLSNPLANRTKSEVLSILSEAGVPHLLAASVSCAYRRARPAHQIHCGVCSQCIERRFASMHAGLEEYDPVEGYGKDIFCEEIPEGRDRTLALSFVRFANDVHRLPHEAVLDKYIQLFDSLIGSDPHLEKRAWELSDLMKRHAASVVKVIEDEIARHKSDFLTLRLSPHGIIRLVTGGYHAEDVRLYVVRWLADALRRGLPPAFEHQAPKNEIQVQDACNTVLQSVKAGLRREVPLLPFAGVGTKPDFVKMPPEAAQDWLFIEMKYPKTRKRLPGIVEEITSRMHVYRKQGAYVLFGVYDEPRTIFNDEDFKADLGTEQGVWVEIIR